MSNEEIIQELNRIVITAQVAADQNMRLISDATTLKNKITNGAAAISDSGFQRKLATAIANREKRYAKK